MAAAMAGAALGGGDGGGGSGLSRLPVRPARGKRAAGEAEPAAPEQKRARPGPAAPGRLRPTGPPAACRVPLRPLAVPPAPGAPRRAMSAVAAPRTAAPAALPAGKKRAAWDLKGQVSDMRAALSSSKEKARSLAGENQQLQKRLQTLEQQLREQELHGGALESRLSALGSELLACQEQARQQLRELTDLSGRKQQLEQQLEQHVRTVDELQAAKRELVALLESREAKLRLTEETLARREQEAAELRARAEAQQRSLRQQDERLHGLEMERRRLHNLVQELKGNIRVFCRVRPLLESEKETQKGLEHLHFSPQDNKALALCRAEESHTGRDRKGDVKYDFSFDRVFPPACSQAEVFEEIALLVQSALDGYHVCIFAYGQTGSGKTYTMEGPDVLDAEKRGMIPRAVRQVFQGAQELAAKGWQYRFTASFLEIYNESLRDLLVGRPERGGGGGTAAELEIRRVSSASEELHVPNLRCVAVASEEEVLELLRTAKANRSVAKTALNDRSSRSHSVFQLRLEGWNASRDLRCSSVLSLVDLAGSERLDKSLSKGERLRETQAINASLSALGLVIMALSNKEPHVPYRNSKLTYLLQNSLGGTAKMLMFVNISPLEENFAESLNSLRFASKVNECVVGTAHANRK